MKLVKIIIISLLITGCENHQISLPPIPPTLSIPNSLPTPLLPTSAPSPTFFIPTTTSSPTAEIEQIIAIIGDFGSGDSNAKAVASLVTSWNPDIIATVGDNRYDLGYKESFSDLYPMCSDPNRCYLTLGNHDYSDGGGLAEYLKYFSLPGNKRWYDVSMGPVHLWILNSMSAGNDPDWNTQQQWLQKGLAISSAWDVVIFHHAPFSSGSYHGSSKQTQLPFAAWGANAVITGHEHVYERLLVDGIPYFVNGAGGGALYQLGPLLTTSQAYTDHQYGAMRLSAATQTLTFEFITTNGQVQDTYVIFK